MHNCACFCGAIYEICAQQVQTCYWLVDEPTERNKDATQKDSCDTNLCLILSCRRRQIKLEHLRCDTTRTDRHASRRNKPPIQSIVSSNWMFRAQLKELSSQVELYLAREINNQLDEQSSRLIKIKPFSLLTEWRKIESREH